MSSFLPGGGEILSTFGLVIGDIELSVDLGGSLGSLFANLLCIDI